MATNWWEPHKPFSTSTQKYIIKITKATVAKKRRCNGYKPQLKFSNKTFSSENTLLLIFQAEFVDEYWCIFHYQYYDQVKKMIMIYTCSINQLGSLCSYLLPFKVSLHRGFKFDQHLWAFFNFCRKTVWMHNMHPSWLRYPEAWKTPDLSQTQLRT